MTSRGDDEDAFVMHIGCHLPYSFKNAVKIVDVRECHEYYKKYLYLS